MMKTVFLFLISFTLCLGFYGCKYTCLGYDTSDKAIISFRLNDTIMYLSQENDTIIFMVNNFYAEGESSFNGLVMDYECNPLAYYEALHGDETNDLYIKEEFDWQVRVSFCKDAIYKFPSGMYRSFEGKNDILCIYVNEKTIDGEMYKSVWEIEDLSGQRRIDKFIKVFYYGILEFHDKITGLTWKQIIKH